ncbi:hypothetical protein H6A35_09695 [Collinsella tanakaei]|uniref:hypothetical protein n=1 Tax=Collinsella ihumii TaxID=1720204 RepID=UPI00195CC3A5|nr:hypothetical protein [Collinsella ihumii]MBM6689129.1 hypothetical protein [Collinsella tanakaei]MDN0056500.1 hypothetical protein [Collinsella ihumii]
MPRGTEPLSYAIFRLFEDGEARCAADVVRELKPAYGRHKLLTERDVDEVMTTAKENGLLDEAAAELDDGRLRISFSLSRYGYEMVKRYL